MKDDYNNQEKEVNIEIFQESSIFPIRFLIYINRVFKQVKKKLPRIVLLLFVNDLAFIASEISVKKIIKTLKKVRKIVLE